MENKYELLFISIVVILMVGLIGGIIYYFNKSQTMNNTNTSNTNNISSTPTAQDTSTANNCSTDSSLSLSINPTPVSSTNTGVYTTLGIQDVVVGTGKDAQKGNTVVVNYIGRLPDGTLFDSSLNPNRQPFSFVLGAGNVIPGWDQGLIGMKECGKRILTIPSALAYGAGGAGNVIKPNYDLVFEVQLLQVK